MRSYEDISIFEFLPYGEDFVSFRKDRRFDDDDEDEDDDHHHRFRLGLKGRSADSAHRATCGALRRPKQMIRS